MKKFALDLGDVLVFGGLLIAGSGLWLQLGLGIALIAVGSVLVSVGLLLAVWPALIQRRYR